MDFKGIILSEISQREMLNDLNLYVASKKKKKPNFIEKEIRLINRQGVGGGGGRRGIGGRWLKGTKFQLYDK